MSDRSEMTDGIDLQHAKEINVNINQRAPEMKWISRKGSIYRLVDKKVRGRGGEKPLTHEAQYMRARINANEAYIEAKIVEIISIIISIARINNMPNIDISCIEWRASANGKSNTI